MGLRDWVFGGSETPLERANRLRGEAMEAPDAVAVGELVELFLGAQEHAVARASAKGIAAVAEQRPERLAAHTGDLLEGTTVVEGPGARQRGELAEALARVAAVEPAAVAAHAEDVVAAVRQEQLFDEGGGEGHLHVEKTAALCRAVAAAEIEAAGPVVESLRRHTDPSVSDAAREAMNAL
ncbi:MAG: hypothetical protein ABEJ31_02960 [Haloarculaceae archaeon]